jgi:hypothetical protein
MSQEPAGEERGVGRRDLVRLFQKALALRVLLAVGLHLFVDESVFAPDQVGYHRVGEWLAHYWSGDVVVAPPNVEGLGPRAYFYIVGALYVVFGANPLVPKLVNCLVGALLVPVVFDLGVRVTGSRLIALRTSKFVAYFPSLVLWSALNIRDAWIVLLIALLCREALVLQERPRLSSLLVIGGGVWLIIHFRPYLLFAITLPMLVSFVVRQRAHMIRNTVLGMMASLAVIYADQAAGSERRLRTIDFQEIQEFRYWGTVGAGSSFEQADISSPGKALLFLPKGLAFFLLAPFPWMLGSIRQILAVPETLFFYTLILPMLRGIRHLMRHRLGTSIMILLLTIGLTFGYALGEGNAGTAYRHRAQMLCFYLLFAATGIEVKRAARARAELPSAVPRTA